MATPELNACASETACASRSVLLQLASHTITTAFIFIVLSIISCLWFFNVYMVNLHRISAQSYVRLGLHLRPPVAGLPEHIHVLFDMPGSKHCSDYVKGMLTLLHQQGQSNRETARRLGISKGTVCYNIRKCVETGSMARAAGSGRPRKTDVRGDRFIKMVALQNRAATLRDNARSYKDATAVGFGSDIVRRRLATHGIFRRIAKRKPLLTRRHKADRLRWARDHAHWTEHD